MTRTAALIVGLLSSVSAAVEAHGRVHGWLGPGFDSNVTRDIITPGIGTISPDGFLYGLVEAEGRLVLLERLRLRGAYDAGGRIFLLNPSENTVVQSAQLEATLAILPWLDFSLLGRARDRRGADRDYTDLSGGAEVALFPADPVEVRVSVAAHRFIYWPRFDYSWFGPDGLVSAKNRIDRHHSLSVFGLYNPRTYSGKAKGPPPPPPDKGTQPEPSFGRADSVLGAGAAWAYRGGFQLSAGYSYFDTTSNSWGETIRRHRLTATGAVRLPWELTAFASGTLQLASYPQGFSTSEFVVMNDEDFASSVSAKLARPVGAHVDLDIRYAFYFSTMPTANFVYQRHVVTIGVSVNF